MTKIIILFIFLSFFSLAKVEANEKQDYTIYHQQLIEAEHLLASENYGNALLVYEQLFRDYDFVFLREYQIATQLALYLNDKQKAIKYLKQGIILGWEMKSIKRNEYLAPLRKDEDWKSIKKEYANLNKQYESKLNQKLRKQVKRMYSKDQKKAFMALFRFGSKAQGRYAERKFAPHSERQMAKFSEILETYGYPGEKLIGNSTWMATILSHHNSISTAYNKKDTLYPELRPKLEDDLKNGLISPYELALIDDWYLTVKYDRKIPTYGILDPPSQSNMPKTNELREIIYARPYELRDALVDIKKKTGMNLYLSDRWY